MKHMFCDKHDVSAFINIHLVK